MIFFFETEGGGAAFRKWIFVSDPERACYRGMKTHVAPAHLSPEQDREAKGATVLCVLRGKNTHYVTMGWIKSGFFFCWQVAARMGLGMRLNPTSL